MVKLYCFLIVTLNILRQVVGRTVFHGSPTLNHIPWFLKTDFNSLENFPQDDVCFSEACQVSARNILDSVDGLIDPCEDFYTYACGGWIKKHQVPSTENQWNQFDILDSKLDSQLHEMLAEKEREDDISIIKAAKKVYRTCMDTDKLQEKGLKPLVELLDELNGWPIAYSNWNEEKFNWQKLIGYITRKVNVNPLLFIYVDVDRKNTSNYVISVDQPSLILPRYLLVHPHGYIEPYITFMAKAAELIAKARNDIAYPYNIHIQAYKVMKFEMELAKITKKEEDRRDMRKLYNKATIRQLQQWTDSIPLSHETSRIQWESFLGSVLSDSSQTLTDDTPVVITDLDFLQKVIKLIDSTSPKVLANYIIWRVVKTMSRDLNKEMTQLNFEFKKQFSAITEDHPRWRECVGSTGYLTFAVGYMYVKKHFSDEAKSKAITMVENIRAAFRSELSEISWMDDKTKEAALEKADFMNHFIGYPDWYTNVTALEEYYQEVQISDDHFKNKISLRAFLARKVLEKLKINTDRDEWTTSPAIANAFYNPLLNSIIFPAGILQHPFFHKDQPEALNYGSIGAVIGHEITHGFDDTGRQSDKLGNVHQWWSKETEETYLKNAECFIDQYQNYRVPELDIVLKTKVTMNGVVTLGENIADNGGLRAALRAYRAHKKQSNFKDWKLPGLERYSSEQLFYLGFAGVWCESTTEESLLSEVLGDSHSPHRLRVIGTLSNSPDFARAWGCTLGSKMNPEKKCQLW